MQTLYTDSLSKGKSNGAAFCNLRGPFFKKGGPPKGIISTWVAFAGCFATILEHSGQLKNPRCLSGEIMTQTKKKKAIETIRGCIKVQSKFIEQRSSQCCCQ